MITPYQYRQNSQAGSSMFAIIGLSAAFALAGCEQQGSPEKTSGTVERTTENTAPRSDRSPDRPAGKMEGVPETPLPSVGTGNADIYIDDAKIKDEIEAAILDDPALGGSRIEVASENGVVQLTGSVDSEQTINKVRALANKQQGVKSVQTDLTINPAPGE
jgi:hyperosmotically inducible protein